MHAPTLVCSFASGGGGPWRAIARLGPLLVIDSGSWLTVVDPTLPPPVLPVTLNIRGNGLPQHFALLGDTQLVFRGAVSSGLEPMITDGTVAGTRMIKDVAPGATASTPDYFTSLGSRVIFFASTPTAGVEPWSTDGTDAGTVMLADVAPGNASSFASIPDQSPVLPEVFAGEAYMILKPGAGNANGLYATNGLAIRQVDLGGLVPAGPLAATSAGVFFVSTTAATGREVFVTNGQPGGTHLAAELSPGTASSSIRDISPWSEGDPRALIGAASSPPQLWSTDGSAPTAHLILGPTYDGSSIVELMPGVAAGLDYFMGVRTQARTSIVRIDGTTGSACTVASLSGSNTSIDSRTGHALTRVHSRIFLIGSEPVLGLEPRVIDLCPADFNNSGAVGVQDIFDYLIAWFALDPAADFNGADGVGLQDLFDFLRAWFIGC